MHRASVLEMAIPYTDWKRRNGSGMKFLKPSVINAVTPSHLVTHMHVFTCGWMPQQKYEIFF